MAQIASHGICETDRARRLALTLGVLELVHVVTPPENLTRGCVAISPRAERVAIYLTLLKTRKNGVSLPF